MAWARPGYAPRAPGRCSGSRVFWPWRPVSHNRCCRWRPAFGSTALVGLLHNIGIYGAIFVLSLAFQRLRGLDTVTAGLLFLPMTGGLAIGTRLGPRLLKAFRLEWLLVGGHLAAGAAALVLAQFDVAASGLIVAAPLAVIGVGAGITTPAMSLSILGAVDPGRCRT